MARFALTQGNVPSQMVFQVHHMTKLRGYNSYRTHHCTYRMFYGGFVHPIKISFRPII